MSTTRENLMAELDRRIANIEKEAEWRNKAANEYFEAFKRYVATSLKIDNLAAGCLDNRIREISNAYHYWTVVVAERNQLRAMKEDIEAGRVNLDP